MQHVNRQVAGKKYTLWDDFLVEGRRGGQQEMTLGDLFSYIKVQPPFSSRQGKHALSSHPVLLSAYLMHVCFLLNLFTFPR